MNSPCSLISTPGGATSSLLRPKTAMFTSMWKYPLTPKRKKEKKEGAVISSRWGAKMANVCVFKKSARGNETGSIQTLNFCSVLHLPNDLITTR